MEMHRVLGRVIGLGLLLGGAWRPLAARESVPTPDTQVHEFVSVHTGRTYQLRVGLPAAYDPARQRYTVVYQLDGQWDFRRTFTLARALAYDWRLAPMIVVGITYGGSDPDYGALRQRDYTPTDFIGGGAAGDAARFLQTVRNEIIPWVESSYACRDERILMGSSYGGLFTGYALLHAPALFSGYVLSAPSFWVDNYVMVNQATTLGPGLAGHPVRVRIVTGALEAYSQRYGAQRFHDVLAGLNLPDLDLRLKFAADERHGAVAEMAYLAGLPEVVQPQLVTFDGADGGPRAWTGPRPPVTFTADDVLRIQDPATASARRVIVFDPSSPARATVVAGEVVILDGQWDAGIVDEHYGALLYDNETLPVLRVGVDWEGTTAQILAWRDQAFTPTDPLDDQRHGGAAAWRAFVRGQVFPFAEAHLTSAPPYRLVMASEKAALWALTDLLSDSPSFDRYLLVSPAVGWDDEWLLTLEAQRATRGGPLAARVLIYSGGDEDATTVREPLARFVTQLRARGYAGLTLEHVELTDHGYAQTKYEGYHKGLRRLIR